MNAVHKNPLSSLILPALAAAVVLAGCQRQEVREDAPPPVPAAAPAKPAAPARPAKPAPAQAAAPAADAKTGVAACDAYLADYHRCHAALGMGSLEQIDQRYQEVRAGMLRRAAQDDATLGPSCEGLQRQMQEALAGRECLPPLPTAPDEQPGAGSPGTDR